MSETFALAELSDTRSNDILVNGKIFCGTVHLDQMMVKTNSTTNKGQNEMKQ